VRLDEGGINVENAEIEIETSISLLFEERTGISLMEWCARDDEIADE